MKRTILGSALAVGLAVAAAWAADRLDFPEDFAGPPLYTSYIDSPDDGWTAIPFLRDPDCIADDANLVGVDFAARNCTLTVHGYVIRSAPPPVPPDVLHIEGNEGMPVWLLSSSDFADAFADGVLTLAELEDASSLVKGTADTYVLHQSVKDPVHFVATASGTLADGRSFKAKENWHDGEVTQVEVTVK